MGSESASFEAWSAAFMREAAYRGPAVPDVDERISRILNLWNTPIPQAWTRGRDDHRWDGIRYRRGDKDEPNRGEGQLEHKVLVEHFPDIECLGGRLVDGINAVPLGPGRSVEADMLLLVGRKGMYEQLLVEAKVAANNCWYAVVENLRQLALFEANDNLKAGFGRRRLDCEVPDTLPVSGLILAPESYYKARGQKSESVAPARRLIEAVGVNLKLAIWRELPRPSIALLKK